MTIMREGPPKKTSAAKESQTLDTKKEYRDELRDLVGKFGEQPGDPGAQSGPAGPEAVFDMDTSDKIDVLRDQVRRLEADHKNLSPNAIDSDKIEQEILEKEQAIRALEKGNAELSEIVSEEDDSATIPADQTIDDTPSDAVISESTSEPEQSDIDPLDYYGYDKPAQETADKTPETDAATAEFTIPEEILAIHNEEASALLERTGELDKQAAETLGEAESSWIRSWGEKYNRLPMKWKVGIGLSLHAGAALTTGPMFLAAVGGLGFQRVSGGLGMFVHFEDRLLATQSTEKMSKRERQAMAALGSIGYSAAAAGAAMGATYLALEAAEPLRDWLGDHWPFGGTEAAAAPDPIEAAVSSSDLSVNASNGKGYEFMAKRLWEQLHEQGLDPASFPEGSDLQQLAMADEKSIDGLVHRIASEHGFYNADGTSVLVRPDDVLSFNDAGEIQLGNANSPEVVVQAPEDSSTTPRLEPSNPDVRASTNSIAEAVYPSGPEQHTAILDADGNDLGIDTSYETANNVPDSVINNEGLEIMTAESHLYADKDGNMIAYGGSPGDRAHLINEYLQDPQNADKVVYSPNATETGRVEWKAIEGQATPNEVTERRGFWYKMFGDSKLKSPNVNDLRTLIK